MKKRDIKIKNFFSAGSLKNSYFRKYIKKQTNNQSKKFDICIVYVKKNFLKMIKDFHQKHQMIVLLY